jgi:hypothetical protein
LSIPALTDHVDIGIAQYRLPLDLEWLNWLVQSLGGDAACDARRGNFVVVLGDADGRGGIEFGAVALLGQYAVEAGLQESRGNARADAERGGFSFVPGV